MLATEELLLVHDTVRPVIVTPLDDFAVAVSVTDSDGLTRADDRLIVTVDTVAGGGFVVPPSPLLPPQAIRGLSTTARTRFATRI
jgi:hypothetical protein